MADDTAALKLPPGAILVSSADATKPSTTPPAPPTPPAPSASALKLPPGATLVQGGGDYLPITGGKEKRERHVSVDQRMQKFFENHPVLREAMLGAAGGAGIPESPRPVAEMASGLYHTVTDAPQTPDENVAASWVPLPTYRLVKGMVQQVGNFGQEAFNSIDWEKFKREADAKGYTATTAEGVPMLELKPGAEGAPRAAHAVAGMATMLYTMLKGGRTAAKVPEAAARAGERVGEAGTVTAQRMADTGPKLARKTTEGAIKDRATYDAAVARINEDTAATTTAIHEKYANDVGTRARELERLRQEHAAKVVKAREEWTRNAADARKGETVKGREETRRRALERGQTGYARMTIKNLKDTYNNIRKDFKSRWDDQRKLVGDYAQVKTAPIVEVIEKGKERLAGTPPSVAILEQVKRSITEDKALQEAEGGGSHAVPKNVSFQSARTNAHALIDAAYSAADAGTRAVLMQVYEAYTKAIRNAVEEGATKHAAYDRDPLGQVTEADRVAGRRAVQAYDKLNSDWHQFKTDWDDPVATAKGGSPLVNARKAVDPHVIMRQIAGDADGRMVETLGKYTKFGAKPAIVAKITDLSEQIKGIAKPSNATEVPSAEAGLRATEPQPAPTEKGKGGSSLKAQLEVAGVKPFEEPKPSAALASAERKTTPPVEPRVARAEAIGAKKIERVGEPPPEPLLDAVVDKLREAKQQAYESVREGALTPGSHDVVLGSLSIAGSWIGHNVGYAIPYTALRFGEAALVRSELGRSWLTKITPKDIRTIQKVLEKAPEDKPAVTVAITKGLIDKAQRGEQLPLPLRAFKGLLTEAQLGSILRVIAPPQGSGKKNPRDAEAAAGAGIDTVKGAAKSVWQATAIP